MSDKLERVLSDIDGFNRQDPNGVELDYSGKLTQWVLKLRPEASDYLKIAARGQHIGRWTIPRNRYEMNRGGYLRWREDLKKFHAEKVGEIMRDAGYGVSEIERVQRIIRKKNLSDPETQTMEDALCLVFLENQYEDLKKKTGAAKMDEIVKKTLKKMSPEGQKWINTPFS